MPFRFAEAARVLPTADAADTPHSIDAKDDPYDYNRDKLVNATDQIIVRNSRTSPFTALKLITPPREDDGRSDGEGEWGGDLWTKWTGDRLSERSAPLDQPAARESLDVPLTAGKELLYYVELAIVTRPTRSAAKMSRSTQGDLDLLDMRYALDDHSLVGPTTERQSHNVSRHTDSALDRRGRSRQRTLDEALQGLLAEWERPH